MNYEPLDRYIAANTTPIFPTSFGAIREQMKEKFGEHGWIGKFVTASKGLTPADGRAYQSERKKVERWNSFEKTGKYNPDRASAASKAQIEKAGKSLDPVGRQAPASGLTVTIDFQETTGRRAPERSTPALHMDFATAQQYVNQARPDYAFLFDLWGDKKIGTYLFGEDGPYPADILAVS